MGIARHTAKLMLRELMVDSVDTHLQCIDTKKKKKKNKTKKNRSEITVELMCSDGDSCDFSFFFHSFDWCCSSSEIMSPSRHNALSMIKK